MAQRLVNIPGLGEAILSRRRGTKHIRLSVNAEGLLRISVPSLIPFAAGIAFAKSRHQWIEEQQNTSRKPLLRQDMRIGKAHRLEFVPTRGDKLVSTRVTSSLVTIASNLPLTDDRVQSAANKAAERALKSEASNLLPQRLRMLASNHGLKYTGVSIKKLSSRWGAAVAKNISP